MCKWMMWKNLTKCEEVRKLEKEPIRLREKWIVILFFGSDSFSCLTMMNNNTDDVSFYS